MAQIVDYFEDFHTEERRREAYSEGPFVLVPLIGINDNRVECELPGANYSALCCTSVYRYLREHGIPTRGDHTTVEMTVDHLNQMVRDGRIVMHARLGWYVPE